MSLEDLIHTVQCLETRVDDLEGQIEQANLKIEELEDRVPEESC